MGDILYASDLIDDLGTPAWLANKLARLYSYEQLAASSLDDMMSVFGKESLGELRKITAHARIKTGVKFAASILLDPVKLAGVRGMSPSLARSLIAVFPTVEELENVEPEALSDVITGLTEYAAIAVNAYAKLLCRQRDVRGDDTPLSTDLWDGDDVLGELFIQALNLWVAKGLDKKPSKVVLFGQNGPAFVTVRGLEPGCFCFSIKGENAEFFMDVGDTMELRLALDAMGEPFARLRVKRVLEQLKLYAERYNPPA